MIYRLFFCGRWSVLLTFPRVSWERGRRTLGVRCQTVHTSTRQGGFVVDERHTHSIANVSSIPHNVNKQNLISRKPIHQAIKKAPVCGAFVQLR